MGMTWGTPWLDDCTAVGYQHRRYRLFPTIQAIRRCWLGPRGSAYVSKSNVHPREERALW